MDNKATRVAQATSDELFAHKLLDAFGGDLPMNPESVKRKLSKMGIKNPQQQKSVYSAAMLLLNFP